MEFTGYHGTATKFDQFQFCRSDPHPSKIGVWFASTPQAAAVIAAGAKRMVDDVPRVIEARLRMDSPAAFESYSDYLAAFRDAGSSAHKLRRKLKREGFDGVKIARSDTDGAGERVDYAVFGEHQITILASSPVEAKRPKPRLR